jgi:hypothetical protein
MIKTTLFRLVLPVFCLISFSLPSFAQQNIDPSKVQVNLISTEPRLGQLDEHAPAASFEIVNKTNRAVHLITGEVLISTGSRLTGKLWTRIGEGDSANMSPRVVINPPGTTGFLLDHMLTIPAGESRNLHFFVELPEERAGQHIHPLTLEALYFMEGIIRPGAVSGNWNVPHQIKYDSDKTKRDLSISVRYNLEKNKHPEVYSIGTLHIHNRKDSDSTYHILGGRFAYIGCSIQDPCLVYIGNGPPLQVGVPGNYSFGTNLLIPPGKTGKLQLRIVSKEHEGECSMFISISDIFGGDVSISRDVTGPDWPAAPKDKK